MGLFDNLTKSLGSGTSKSSSIKPCENCGSGKKFLVGSFFASDAGKLSEGFHYICIECVKSLCKKDDGRSCSRCDTRYNFLLSAWGPPFKSKTKACGFDDRVSQASHDSISICWDCVKKF